MIRIRNLTKTFQTRDETVLAMDDLTLDIETDSFFTLLGPSGCGKSTLLRCIAGLESPDSGEIWIGERLVYSSARGVDVPPNRREIGMVFQSYAIWPHMTVAQNVAFPLKVRGKDRIEERVSAALAMVGLEALGGRYASRLSGGQQQRAAFARAIVAEPDLLLLDEPLSNLDAALREQMRAELRKLQERVKVTTIYVTHDQAEALSMSDRIAVMRAGRFVEVAAPEDLYEHPRSVFTAQFIGGANILEGRVEDVDAEHGRCLVDCGFARLWATGTAKRGQHRHLFLRPEHVRPVGEGASPPSADGNLIEGRVIGNRFVGDSREIELALEGPDGGSFILRSKVGAGYRAGTAGAARIFLDPAHVLVLDDGD
jgi:iron(III) transport system ATP-binding protein